MSPAVQDGIEDSAQEGCQSAQEEGQGRENRALAQCQMPAFLKIRWQPGDIEIPTVRQAEILPAQHPDLL